MVLVVLGSAALVLTMLIVWSESRRFAEPDAPSVVISETQPDEVYGRLLPKDLLNAFARFVAASRAISLDDRVYSFSETKGRGAEDQPSDYAEFIAESAPLVYVERLVVGPSRLILIVTAIVAEFLAFLSAILVFRETTSLTKVVQLAISAVRVENYGAFISAVGGSFIITLLLALLLFKFSNLFRELALRFLGEVVFHSLMMSISISSSVVSGRHETTVSQSEGAHLFDAGKTSLLRLRIQTAGVQTATMVSSAGGADSLGMRRYIVALKREDRLLAALAQEAYRYIRERTGAATTRVRSATVDLKDAEQLLVDSGSGPAFFGVEGHTALSNRRSAVAFLPKSDEDDEAPKS
jgi:hypothetical protein